MSVAKIDRSLSKVLNQSTPRGRNNKVLKGAIKFFFSKFRYKLMQYNKAIFELKSRLDHNKNIALLHQYADQPLRYRPIFVLGPPRCGSTLLYQAMLHKYNFSYFQNIMMKYKYSVAFHTYKNIDPKANYNSDYTSDHGQTNNKSGPHEAWPFWRRFYPRMTHDYIDGYGLKEKEVFEIKNTIKFLVDFFNAPFFSKNMEMSLRLKSLQKIFPEALYIILKRDPRAIASSILSARIKYFNNPDIWWSMRPKEYISIRNKTYPEQIALQIVYVYKTIYGDLINKSNSISLYYEDFCNNPKTEMEKIIDFLTQKDILVSENKKTMPEKFSYKKKFLFHNAELEKMHQIFDSNGLLDSVGYNI